MTEYVRFNDWLNDTTQSHGALPETLKNTLLLTANACQQISNALSMGELAGILGAAGSANVQGEDQKKLDVIANDILLAMHAQGGHLRGMASEEMDDPYPLPNTALSPSYLLLFDPLDGSSNIDINAPVGTIFSVLPAPTHAGELHVNDYLQPGRAQVAAGYAIYGPATQLVLTLGHGVQAFTLNRHTGEWLLTQPRMRIPSATQEFAINMSNQRFWEAPVQAYVSDLLAGKTGPRGKDFNMRWVAAMVADVHRLLTRGGVFMYPLDSKMASKGGKLRLMYEANPMSWLIEQAGGRASTGLVDILDIQPSGLHQRVPVMLGAAEEIAELTRLHGQG